MPRDKSIIKMKYPLFFLNFHEIIFCGYRSEVLLKALLHPAPPPPPHTMVYSADRSKAVVPVLVLLFVALWFILRGNLFYVLILCYFVLVFFSPFNIAINSLKKERAFRTFVRFVLVWFPLPLGVWKGLRFVIVAFPGLFSYLLFYSTGRSKVVVPVLILLFVAL